MNETIETNENMGDQTENQDQQDSIEQQNESVDESAEEAQDQADASETEDSQQEQEKSDVMQMTKAEYDAAMAAARKKGISQGRNEIKEQVEQTILPAFTEIYDPATGKPMDPSNVLYDELKKESDKKMAMEYNRHLQNQILKEQEKMDKQQKLINGAYQKVLNDLQKSLHTDPEIRTTIATYQDQLNPDTQGMIYAMSKSDKGVEALADLLKNDLNEAIRISHLPYEEQILEMGKVVSKKSKGKGKPLTSSKAPNPSSSFTDGGSPSVEKRAQDKDLGDLAAEFRSQNNMIS